MDGKITLDRDTFKVLSSDTRIQILKRINERKQTLSDLAEDMGMSPSTIKEHIDRLVEAGLIVHLDRGTKWKYYVLTSKGKSIVSPVETKVWILLSSSLAAVAAIAVDIYSRMSSMKANTLKAARDAGSHMGGSSAPAAPKALMAKSAQAATESSGVFAAHSNEAPAMMAAEETAKKGVESAVGYGGEPAADVVREASARMLENGSPKDVATATTDTAGYAASQATTTLMRAGEGVEKYAATTLAAVKDTASGIPMWEAALFIVSLFVLAATSIFILRRRTSLKL